MSKRIKTTELSQVPVGQYYRVRTFKPVYMKVGEFEYQTDSIVENPTFTGVIVDTKDCSNLSGARGVLTKFSKSTIVQWCDQDGVLLNETATAAPAKKTCVWTYHDGMWSFRTECGVYNHASGNFCPNCGGRVITK